MDAGARRILCLDGLRGLAALWVVVGHAMLLTAFKVPILSNPDLGVDLFILLSGYLMTYQYQVRKAKEDWSAPSTWIAFWVRRFFRLSPLYFTLLVIALAFGSIIYAERSFIDISLGRHMQVRERYEDFSASNLAMHLTYLFGLVPAYAFRTPLPDWSLGLEMQFYAVFPILVLVSMRLGWLRTCLLVVLAAAGVVLALRWLDVRYPMPSFLPLKMHLFAAGILIAASRGKLFYFLIIVVLAAIPYGGKFDPFHVLSREFIVSLFFFLINFQHVRLIGFVADLLGSGFFFWLGELSYGCYLIHLLVLHPVASAVIRHFGPSQAPLIRFMIAFPIVAIASYALAFVGYRLLEKPGQQWGRQLLNRMNLGSKSRQTVAEQIDAP